MTIKFTRFLFIVTFFLCLHHAAQAQSTVPKSVLAYSTPYIINNPSGIAVDASGYMYITNTASNTILKITPSGVSTPISTAPFTLSAANVRGICVDGTGNIYITDGTTTGRILKITSTTTGYKHLHIKQPQWHCCRWKWKHLCCRF